MKNEKMSSSLNNNKNKISNESGFFHLNELNMVNQEIAIQAQTPSSNFIIKNNNANFDLKKQNVQPTEETYNRNFNPDENQFLLTKKTMFYNNNQKVRNRLNIQHNKHKLNRTKSNSGYMSDVQMPGIGNLTKNFTHSNFRSNSQYNLKTNNNTTNNFFNPLSRTGNIGINANIGILFTNNLVKQELKNNNDTDQEGRFFFIKPVKQEPIKRAYTTKFMKDVLVPDSKCSYQHFKSKLKYDNFTITRELKRGLCKDNYEKFYDSKVKPYEMYIPIRVFKPYSEIEHVDEDSNNHQIVNPNNHEKEIQVHPSIDELIIGKQNKDEEFFLTKIKRAISNENFLPQKYYSRSSDSNGVVKCKRTEKIYGDKRNVNEKILDNENSAHTFIQKCLKYKKGKTNYLITDDIIFESAKEKENYLKNLKRIKYLNVYGRVFGRCKSIKDEIFQLNQKNKKNEEAILVNHVENNNDIIKKLNQAKMYKTDSLFNPFKQLYKLVYKPF